MLVLTRKYQEKIRIGSTITITVLRAKGKPVRLGIEAPADVPVIRGELVFEAGREAGGSEPSATARTAPGSVAGHVQRRHRDEAEPAASWTTDARPTDQGHSPSRQATRVDLRRVPRDKVAEVLPQLVAGSSPLRAMLDRRSVV